MTKDEWATAERQATSPFDRCDLMVDGYKITLQLGRLSPYRNAIGVYINGVMDGKMMIEDCEERRRFYREVLHTPGPAKPPKGITAKRWAQARKEHTYSTWYPYWTNFAALRRHLIKNNSSIELISKEGDREQET